MVFLVFAVFFFELVFPTYCYTDLVEIRTKRKSRKILASVSLGPCATSARRWSGVGIGMSVNVKFGKLILLYLKQFVGVVKHIQLFSIDEQIFLWCLNRFYRGVKVKQGSSSWYQIWLRLLMKIVPPALIWFVPYVIMVVKSQGTRLFLFFFFVLWTKCNEIIS